MFPFGAGLPFFGLGGHDAFDKDSLVQRQTQDRRRFEDTHRGGGITFHHKTTHSDPRSAQGSMAPLRRLKQMRMRELTPGTRHAGRYVRGRICAPATKMTGVMLILESEEEEGTACQLAVYNMCPPEAGPRQLDRLFTVGARLVVREPYFKLFADGSQGMRVDNPGDIVFLAPSDGPGGSGSADGGAGSGEAQADAADDPERLRQRGNELFKAGEYEEALSCYERCAELAPANVTALANSAAVLLELERWEQAYLVCRRALQVDPSHPKARFRLARAMLHLRCYGPALEHLQALRKQMPGDRSVAEQLRAAEALAAQAQGRFDTASILTKQAGSRKVELADWVGPIDVFSSPVAGCGLRATKAVKAGELLMVERALAWAETPPNTMELHIDFGSRRMNKGSQQGLAAELLRLCCGSALDRQRLLVLSAGEEAGDHRGHERASRAVLPFQSEDELWSAVQAAQADAASSHGPDLHHMLGVVSANAWGTDGGRTGYDPALPRPPGERGEHSAVWALLCLANHSCRPNAHIVFMGGTAMLRASRDIAAGEEVLVAYNEDLALQDVRKRREHLRRGWGFYCRCPRCAQEEGLPRAVLDRMEDLNEELEVDPLAPGRLLAAYRSLNRLPPAQAAREARPLLAQVQGRLAALEAELRSCLGLPPASQPGAQGAKPGSEGGAEEQEWGLYRSLASVMGAYRLATALTQMTGDAVAAMQSHRRQLRIIEAARPGGTEHVVMAASFACDALGGRRRLSHVAAQRGRKRGGVPQQAVAQAVRAAKMRYGRELPDAAALTLIDTMLARITAAA